MSRSQCLFDNAAEQATLRFASLVDRIVALTADPSFVVCSNTLITTWGRRA